MEIFGIIMIIIAGVYVVRIMKDISLMLWILIGAMFLTFGVFENGKMQVYNKIAGEIIIMQIPVKGEYHSIAQVEIIHRDGELADVILVKGTTVPKKDQ